MKKKQKSRDGPLAPPGVGSVEVDSARSNIPESRAATNATGAIYSCTYRGCTSRFETETQLHNHKAGEHHRSGGSQAGPHWCKDTNPRTGKPCNRVFSRPYDLTRHQKDTHNETNQKYKCDFCEKPVAFQRADNLTRHHRICHPDILTQSPLCPPESSSSDKLFITFTRQNDGSHWKAERRPSAPQSGVEVSPVVPVDRRNSCTVAGKRRRLSEGQATMVIRRSKRTLAPNVAQENRDGTDGICDHEDPCKGYSERGLERGYESINPQAQLNRIEDDIKDIKEMLASLGGQVGMLRMAEGGGASKSVESGRNHSHPQPPSPRPPGSPPPEGYMQYRADFQKHILPLCPLLTPDELGHDKFRSLLDSDEPAEKAVALLVCALGEWCQGALQERRSSRPNVHYAKAVSLVEHNKGQSRHYLFAHILIALYRGLSGDVYGSGRAIAKAARIVRDNPLPKTPRLDVTAEENSRRVASWICVGMESDFCSLLPYRKILTGARIDIPTPLFQDGLMEGIEPYIIANFVAFVWLYRALNISETSTATTFMVNLETLPPGLLPVDLDAPASNITTALIQATRWNAVVAKCTPSIRRFCHSNLAPEDCRMAEPGIRGLIRSLEVFHPLRPQALLIVPNIVRVAYWQVRNMLLLEKCHSCEHNWSGLDIDMDLKTLLDSTILFLNALSDGPSGLTVNTAVLTSLRKKVLSYDVSSIDGMAWDVLQVNNEAIAIDVSDEDDAEIEQWEYDTETSDIHQQGESIDELRARVRWLEQKLASFRGHRSSLA